MLLKENQPHRANLNHSASNKPTINQLYTNQQFKEGLINLQEKKNQNTNKYEKIISSL